MLYLYRSRKKVNYILFSLTSAKAFADEQLNVAI